MTEKLKKKEQNGLKKLLERSQKLAFNMKALEPKIEEFNRYFEEKKTVDMQILIKENELLKQENESLKAERLENATTENLKDIAAEKSDSTFVDLEDEVKKSNSLVTNLKTDLLHGN